MACSRVNFTFTFTVYTVTHSTNNHLPIEEQKIQVPPNIMEIHSIILGAEHRRTRTEDTRHPISCSTCLLRSTNVQQAAMKTQHQLRSCLYNRVNQSGDNRRILPGNHRTYISIDLVEQSIERIIDTRFVISFASEILSTTLIPAIFRRRTGRVKRRGKFVKR
jgi:hypothetical protein